MPVSMMSYAIRPFCVAVGFVYPAYRSFKALEAKEPEGSATWLTYWLVFSLFSVLECVTDSLISGWTLYFVAKLLFIIWLQLPQTKGATILYVVWIQPLVKKHEERIDSALESGRKSAEENLLVLKSKGIQWGSQIISRTSGKAQAAKDLS
mmetsp:Transcript_7397/g.27159  ORF Transcript_7397/g.27159 Transcript_7397/m.27159 type:complete len:151 (-) Transcript_7397:1190-1642(-)